MTPVVIWTVVALVVAALVMVVAGSAEQEGGLRQFVADLRAGLRGDRPATQAQDVEPADEVAPSTEEDGEEASLETMFDLGQFEGSAYIGTAEIARTLGRATQRTRVSALLDRR